MHGKVVVRDAITEDIPAIAAIYAHHVLHGLASFEVDPPDAPQMAQRRAQVLALGLPYFVAECGGEIAGYAYAGLYRARPAYRYTLENSVYIRHDRRGRGIGSALLPALIETCAGLGYRQMVAVIGDSANTASIRLHEKFGFVRTGLLPAVGWKFGRWVDSVLMQRALGAGSDAPPG
jgi:L-amino acid N-acyltransferase YncA